MNILAGILLAAAAVALGLYARSKYLKSKEARLAGQLRARLQEGIELINPKLSVTSEPVPGAFPPEEGTNVSIYGLTALDKRELVVAALNVNTRRKHPFMAVEGIDRDSWPEIDVAMIERIVYGAQRRAQHLGMSP